MPDRVSDDLLSRLAAGDPFLGATVEETHAMARELLDLRAQVAQLQGRLADPPRRSDNAA